MRAALSVIIAFLFISASSPDAAPAQGPASIPAIPSESGEVVFSCNERSPAQVYIIGTSHRDSLTLANGSDTLRSQIEIYRIGEWLINNRGLELLLPEGFFSDEVSDKKEGSIKNVAPENNKRVSPDTNTLEEKLGKDNDYTNAEILLMQSYGIKSRQVEDIDLYNAAREKIGLLEGSGYDTFESLYIKSGLDYLQERRTAAMLQRIPEIIDREYREGRIKSKKAIFTIGMAHVSGIIKYLKQNKIEIRSPAFTPYDDYLSGVELLEKDFGVTVIIPRTLADNRDLSRLTRLDDIP